MYSMHVFFKELFHSFCNTLFVYQLSFRTDRGNVKQKADRRGQGEGGGLKTCKNVRTSSMDDPLVQAKVDVSANHFIPQQEFAYCWLNHG